MEQGVVYKVKCKDCGKLYIGETGRMLKLRLKEHKYGAKKKKTKKMYQDYHNTCKQQSMK